MQEEPRNMGAWFLVRDRLGAVLEETRRTLRYVGRTNSASPAPMSLKLHQDQQAQIINTAFSTEPRAIRKKILARKKL